MTGKTKKNSEFVIAEETITNRAGREGILLKRVSSFRRREAFFSQNICAADGRFEEIQIERIFKDFK